MLKFFKPRKKLLDAPIRDNAWLAVDVETTGLDPSKDQLLSIGWVAVEGRDIVLEESGHLLIRPEREEVSVGESATVHGLTDDMVATGVEAEVAVGKLLEALRGRKLLAHYARMEVGFVDPLCRKYFDARFDVPVADTMTREYDAILRANREPVRDELRLWSLCDKYGIPRFKAHHAFNDALACALVWLAQESRGV
ncbi:3'-5' exonuclease [Corynebacterium amycolatum]|uniref:3'-5' exonuclease n=1 Tax=Corynebacterium amycolatum TaxID=43765 RepID=UPI001CCDD2F8|nr:3'-5' exonuclease [Corynebacterium amycolatum]MCA0442619.1 3'-5' exonuclease [Corynebacterium amycolatum]